eukprot:2943438-Pyramimonas_sp.AAC.1
MRQPAPAGDAGPGPAVGDAQGVDGKHKRIKELEGILRVSSAQRSAEVLATFKAEGRRVWSESCLTAVRSRTKLVRWRPSFSRL